MFLRGDEELSGYLLRQGIDAGFDLGFSNELRVDHSEPGQPVAARQRHARLHGLHADDGRGRT
jgi:hypothetical protein